MYFTLLCLFPLLPLLQNICCMLFLGSISFVQLQGQMAPSVLLQVPFFPSDVQNTMVCVTQETLHQETYLTYYKY